MIVYKTEQEKQVTAFENWKREREVWTDALRALAEEAVGTSSFLAWRTGSFAGLPWSSSDKPPAGWRVVKGKNHIVPDKRVKAGKEWKKRIDELPRVSERAHCDGQPGCVFHDAQGGGTYMHWPQYHRFTEDGPLFMIWTCDCGKIGEDDYSIISQVDEAIWQLVKLSDFYAEVEAEKERLAETKAGPAVINR